MTIPEQEIQLAAEGDAEALSQVMVGVTPWVSRVVFSMWPQDADSFMNGQGESYTGTVQPQTGDVRRGSTTSGCIRLFA